MMRLIHIIAVTVLVQVLNLPAKGQTPDENLTRWHQENPIEKVYLQLDRKDYFAGQTSWFKAYFLSDFLPSSRNSTLFTELLSPNGKVITQKILPVLGGVSYGQIDIPDTLATGTYQLRAYTPLMLNHNKAYLYHAPIRVYGKQSGKNTSTGQDSIKISFFPEGGILLAGVENNIAFKAVYTSGMPAPVSIQIKDNGGRQVASANVMHDGMGRFILKPEAGQTYSVKGKDFSAILPDVQVNGCAMQVVSSIDGLRYSIQTAGGEKFTPSYLVGQMQHKVLIKQTLKDAFNGQISTSSLPSGILQLTVFNSAGMPLAERLVFIDNKEYQLPATLVKEEISTKARAKNKFSIHLDHAVEGNFSVAVTDDNLNEPGLRQENIISSLLLTSDIPGYVHNPAYYFSGADQAREALDLVMLTNGWRRFYWKQAAENKLPAPLYNDPGFISLSGQVKERGSKKSFADRELLIWVASSDSGRALQMVKTDAEGRFKMDSVIFFDKARILFSDVMGNKSKFLTVKLDTDSLNRAFAIPFSRLPAAGHVPTPLATNLQNAYNAHLRGTGVLLDNVNIEGRRLTLDELEKKYVSGMFAGSINARTINLTGQFVPNLNIFEWLIGRVPGLNIRPGGNFNDEYRLSYRQQPVQLFLDEMQMQDATWISTLPPSQIALIKIYPQFIGARGNGPAVAIYTKRGNDLNDEMETSGDIVDYDGYSIIKEFYSPDYSTPPDINYQDYRLTLHWQPELITDKNDLEIPIQFYNSDRAKKFKIVAEGMTKDGKLLMLEQYVE